MGTAIKHPLPDRVKLSLVIFDIRALDAQGWADVKKFKWRINPVWHRMPYSCTRMATVGVKGLTCWAHIWLLCTWVVSYAQLRESVRLTLLTCVCVEWRIQRCCDNRASSFVTCH